MSFLLIIGIVGYFILQFILGVNIDNPSGQDLLKFGANFLPKTINEPFRLLTAGFVHIGIMHLLFNAFALYYLAPTCEAILGKWRFLCLFLLSIIGGNVLNLTYAWLKFLDSPAPFGLSAGASGGIMGINAALLIISLHPTFKPLLNSKNLLFVLAINIMIGFAFAGIDNAGHIGGAITGAILALILVFLPKFRLILLPIFIIFLGLSFYFLRQNIVSYL